jgi:hypothetical protein
MRRYDHTTVAIEVLLALGRELANRVEKLVKENWGRNQFVGKEVAKERC